MDISALLLVCPLVFLGGFVDAIAGGGGLIALPAYLIAGLPPHLAIGTNKLSSTLGMAVSTWKLARSGFVDWSLAPSPALAAFLGSTGGALLALSLPAEIFKIILLILLPVVACIVLRSKKTDAPACSMKRSRRMLILGACALTCGAYDGFYGPGAGTFLLISFTAFAGLDVRSAAGQMKVANLLHRSEPRRQKRRKSGASHHCLRFVPALCQNALGLSGPHSRLRSYKNVLQTNSSGLHLL